MLQHGFLDDWTYSVRTLQDNVSLVTPALLQELDALLVREGHAVAGKFPGAALDGRVDSFVVETDVHYPTDVNLLWDAMRVLLTEVSVCCGSHGVSGWRQGRYWRIQVRQGYQRVSCARLWRQRPKAVAAWVEVVSRIFCNFQWEWRPAHMGGSPLGAKFSGVSCRLLPCLGFRFGCANHADPVI